MTQVRCSSCGELFPANQFGESPEFDHHDCPNKETTMPTHCDICEDVIDREDTHTRIDGQDYCLNCLDAREKGQTLPEAQDQLNVTLTIDETAACVSALRFKLAHLERLAHINWTAYHCGPDGRAWLEGQGWTPERLLSEITRLKTCIENLDQQSTAVLRDLAK